LECNDANPKFAEQAFIALANFGDAAPSALQNAITFSPFGVDERTHAIKLIIRLGPAAKPLIPTLKAIVINPNDPLRLGALTALRHVADGDDPEVSALIFTLYGDSRSSPKDQDTALALLKSLKPTNALLTRLIAQLTDDRTGDAAATVLASFGDATL